MLEQLLDFSNYNYNPHAIPVILVGTIIFFIGLFILLQTKKLAKNGAFFLFCISLSIWLITIGFVYLANNPQTALLWYKWFTFFGVVNIMPSGYLFTVTLTGLLQKQRKIVIGNYVIANIFYILALTTEKFITSLRLYFWGYYPHYKWPNILFIALYLILYIALQSILWRSYKSEKIPTKKTQILSIFIGFLIAFIASVDFTAKFLSVPVYPFGFIPMLIFVCVLAYSIIRYKAFDIETVIHKTIAWVLASSTAFVPITLLAYWLKPWYQKAPPLEVALLCTGIFYLLTVYIQYTQPKIDHFFQRRKVNLEEILSKFAEDIVYLKGLNNLIQRIEDIIADTLYPQQIDIFIYNQDRKVYTLSNAKVQDTIPASDLEESNKFLEWLAKHGKIVYKEFIEIDPQYASIKKEANDYFNLTEAIVVIPLVLNMNLLGVINLGKKKNFKHYRASDFYFLNTLKNESVIAISNSLLFENMEEQVRQRTKELVEVQSQLVQAEKLATVGTLAGGVAHEINNPLMAILTNVQMLLSSDTINDESDKESLQLIEDAARRGRDIVQKLMVYARKPLKSKELSKINLLDVVKDVISFIGYQLEQDNITIRTQADNGKYLIMGSKNELEHVVTNIILNAKDAIKRVKKSGTIDIFLTSNTGLVELEIKDEGIGMTPEVKSKIFDPFFTTKEVGKGLGLGLSICQAIIERHGGFIKVESIPDEGSIFTIQLPYSLNKEARAKVASRQMIDT